MKILVTGATGLIGSRLRTALIADGHDVIGVARHPPRDASGWIALDIGAADIEDWTPVLAGVDAVVHGVGIFGEHASQSFDRVHVRGAVRLFDACVRCGVKRVVQLSALGADAGAATPYHRSKRAADEHLLQLPLDAVVVQPSLVFAPNGRSAATFLTWASLPVVPLPAGGRQRIQPIFIDDLVAGLAALAEGKPAMPTRRIAMVGPRALTLAEYLLALRHGMGLPRPLTLALPRPVMQAVARAGDAQRRLLGHAPLLDTDSWQMLERGNVGDAAAATALLGRAPTDVRDFIAPSQATAVRQQALSAWLQPVARMSLALVWIGTAVVSVFFFPLADSYELLARTGVPPALRPTALFGAAALDLAFGLALLLPARGQRWRRWMYALQAALILLYTALISWRLPEFWAHPYAPLLKNVPMLALIAWLAALEPRRTR